MVDNITMAPTLQIRWLWTALVLLVIYMTSPFWIGQIGVRENGYTIMPRRFGQLHWYGTQVAEKTNDIDFLFLGGSGIWAAIDAVTVEEEFLKQTGQHVNVEVLCHNWTGPALDFIALCDVLKHRKVKNLFIPLPLLELQNKTSYYQPHSATKYVWTWDVLNQEFRFPLRHKLQIYSEQLLVTPRLFVLKFISFGEVLKDVDYFKAHRAYKNAHYYGSLNKKRGYFSKGKFEGFRTDMPVEIEHFDYTQFLLGRNKKSDFELRRVGFGSEWERAIYLQIIAKAKNNGINIYFIKPPYYRYYRSGDNSVPYFHDEGHSIPTICIPETELFAHVSVEDARHYFYNHLHTNYNGARIFSSTVAKILALDK